MRRWLIGAIALAVLIVVAFGAYAVEPIRIFVNGKELKPDVPPQTIGGRTMVPVRCFAEALGLEVKWDERHKTVFVTTSNQNVIELGQGFFIDNPLPVGKSIITPEGIEITLINYLDGDEVWKIIQDISEFNKAPKRGYKYALATIKVKNVSEDKEVVWVEDRSFAMVGDSGNKFYTYDKLIVLPLVGPIKDLSGVLIDYGKEVTVTLHFYLPNNEKNLVLISGKGSEENKRFFKVQ